MSLLEKKAAYYVGSIIRFLCFIHISCTIIIFADPSVPWLENPSIIFSTHALNHHWGVSFVSVYLIFIKTFNFLTRHGRFWLLRESVLLLSFLERYVMRWIRTMSGILDLLLHARLLRLERVMTHKFVW